MESIEVALARGATPGEVLEHRAVLFEVSPVSLERGRPHDTDFEFTSVRLRRDTPASRHDELHADDRRIG